MPPTPPRPFRPPLPSLLPLVSLLLLIPTTLAGDLVVHLSLSPTNCLFGCKDALDTTLFADTDPTAAYYAALCGSAIFRTSLASCVQAYCTPEEQVAGWDKLIEYCELYGDTKVDGLDQVVATIKGPVEQYDALENVGEVVNGTVLVTRDNWERGTRTENAWERQMNFHHAFGWSMYILFGTAVLVSTSERVYQALYNRLSARRSLSPDSEDSHRLLSMGGATTWWRKNVSVPALFGKRHAEPWSTCSLPTRLQAMVIFFYVAVNLVFSFICYEVFDGNLYWDTKIDQYARYIADRTGIMSFYNLPLLWCLAGRNDVFLWLTGWSYSTASMFHRWVAWVATVQAIAHSAAYTWILRDSLAEEYQTEEYWRTGIWATVVMSVLLAASVRPIRERFYEVFLLAHISLAVCCIVLLFYHVKIFTGDYDPWLWACVGCWVLDRFLRLVRLVALSYRTFFTSSSSRNTRAILAYTDSGLIRLIVRPSIPLSPKPGQYYYLYTPWSLTPWENHPFTLGSWNKTADGETELHFLVGPQKGATGRLQRRIERASKKSRAHADGDNVGDKEAGGMREMDMRVYLEGPYGTSHNLAAFEHVLLVAGGSGVTAILPYVHALQTKQHVQVTVVWSVTHRDYAADVLARELAGVEVQLYITRPGMEKGTDGIAVLPGLSGTAGMQSGCEGEGKAKVLDSASSYTSSTSNSASSSRSPTSPDPASSPDAEIDALKQLEHEQQGVTIHKKRPDMATLVNDAVDELVGGDRLAILACGPGGMMDDLRKAVVDAYGRVPGDQLTYYEDSFGW